MNRSLPFFLSMEALKDQARRLRAALGADGEAITYSKSLELLAHQYGYRNWNTLHAALGNAPSSCPAPLGARMRGDYLGQAFSGDVIGVQTLSSPDRFRVTLQFDEPVDVVTFDGFSNFRQRVSCIIDGKGQTLEKTSDGRPHMRLEI